MKIANSTKYTTRSWKSIIAWAWQKVRPQLTAGQRTKVGYATLRWTLNYSDIIGYHAGNEDHVMVSTSDKRAPNDAATFILTILFRRAGLNGPWSAHATERTTCPKLQRPAKRKPRRKPNRNEPVVLVEKWERRIREKDDQIARTEQSLRTTRARLRTLERRLSSAKKERRQARANLKRASELAREEPATNMSAKDFATRMRAKRQAKEDSPSAAR